MRSAPRLVAYAVAVVTALAALGSGSAATNDAWIVFAASPAHGVEGQQLFRIRVSGTGLRQITSGRRLANDPSFAPHGMRIAFARLGSGLFVVNVDGSGLHRLTGNASDRYPVWSPNGRFIAIMRGAQSGYRLWLMNAHSHAQRLLRRAPATVTRAAWMPDGKSLVIASDGCFYRVSARDGHVEKRLAPEWDVTLGQLYWSLSPNGRTIAYVGRRPEPAGCERTECEVFALYLQRVTSSKPMRFVDDGGVPGWSHDGRRIVYTHGGGLAVETLSGGTTTTLGLSGMGLDPEAPPTWQPR